MEELHRTPFASSETREELSESCFVCEEPANGLCYDIRPRRRYCADCSWFMEQARFDPVMRELWNLIRNALQGCRS